MRDGSAKLIIGTALLVGVWIVAYWLWPARPESPAITFDQTAEIATIAVTPASEELAESQPPPIPAESASENPVGLEFEQAPTPEFQPVIPPEFEEHVVVEGDTIWSIAESKWGDANLGGVIARANPMVDPKRLRPGVRLLIPKDPRNIQGLPVDEPAPPVKQDIVQYVVAPNDTLSDIAKHFYGKASLWTRIRDANPDKVSSEGNVRVGVTLLIPPPPDATGGAQ